MKLTQIIGVLVGAALVVTAASVAFAWIYCRVYVGADQVLVLIAKTGDPVPAGHVIAEPGQKGIQRDVLGPGRYFFNPLMWDWELHPAIRISAGEPATWQEVYAAGQPGHEVPELSGEWPEVGVVTSLAGKPWTGDSEVVDDGFQGIQRKVLTPGVYRLNPYAYKVEKARAVVVPMSCVGIVTSLLGRMPEVETIAEVSIGPDGQPIKGEAKVVQKLATEGERGVLERVLQPGIYFLNPKVYRVDNVQLGYNQLSQFKAHDAAQSIQFPSEDGFTITVDVTVVWGRHPEHVPEMISRFGDVSRIREIILGQIRSICRNIGSKYKSTDFIQGTGRELYQKQVTETLYRVCQERNIELLIALIQNIEVQGGSTPAGEGLDLKQTIQRGHVAVEEELTKQKQRETARVRASLEAARAAIEVAREQISADTRKKVAELQAGAEKQAREIDAQRDLEVAQVERKIAELDAERTRVTGKAAADVAALKNGADAEGRRMMVQAFGTGRAYNLYTFAQGFNPQSIQLIFAGPGTLWTDMSRLQDTASLELLQQASVPKLP